MIISKSFESRPRIPGNGIHRRPLHAFVVILLSVTRFGDLLDFGQVFKAIGNN